MVKDLSVGLGTVSVAAACKALEGRLGLADRESLPFNVRRGRIAIFNKNN